MRPTLVGLIVLLLLSAEQVIAQAPPALVIEAPPELAVARARLDSYDLRPLSAIVRLVGLDAPGPPIKVVLAAEGSEVARQVSPWTAGFAIGEPRLSIGEINALFSGGEGTQSRGYSLAAAMVRDLINAHGPLAPATILRALADGRSLDTAIAGVAARSIAIVEADFWNRQRTRLSQGSAIRPASHPPQTSGANMHACRS